MTIGLVGPMFAQSTDEHLTFKGVPINGTLTEYVTEMKAVGFSDLGTQDGTAILQGDFAGYKQCIVGVSTLKARNVIYTIGVLFQDHDNWSSLINQYEHLKTMLTNKYGKPSACVEEFQGHMQPRSDGDKFLYMRMDRCTYYTPPKGDIWLSLDKRGVMSCFVRLQYWDRINTDTVQTDAMEDL